MSCYLDFLCQNKKKEKLEKECQHKHKETNNKIIKIRKEIHEKEKNQINSKP